MLRAVAGVSSILLRQEWGQGRAGQGRGAGGEEGASMRRVSLPCPPAPHPASFSSPARAVAGAGEGAGEGTGAVAGAGAGAGVRARGRKGSIFDRRGPERDEGRRLSVIWASRTPGRWRQPGGLVAEWTGWTGAGNILIASQKWE